MKSSYNLGLTYILLVSIIWSAASILVQYLYGADFNSPFLLTYIGTSLFIVFIPVKLFWERRKRSCVCMSNIPRNQKYAERSQSSISSDSDSTSNIEMSESEPKCIPWKADVAEHSREILHDFEEVYDEDDGLQQLNEGEGGEELHLISAGIKNTDEIMLSHVEHIKMALKIAPLWFCSNYFYNLSLAYTSITSSTVLSSTGSVFTFIFAVVFGDEKFTRWKVMGVIVAFCGSISTSFHDATQSQIESETSEGNSRYQLWGDAAGLLSAVGYGGYTVMVRTLCEPCENRMSMQLFLGYIGLINAMALSPILFWTLNQMNGSEIDDDEQDDGVHKLTKFILLCLIIKGLLDNVLSDYLWARAIILTSATVATVGLGLTIPMALLSDIFIMGRGDLISPSSIFGALSVLIGFVFVNIGEGREDEAAQIQERSDEHAAVVSLIVK
mmetsp:Transcript_27318/g.40382  ORF Transcript_27318/g.40382 Transcript_27318/m.40382 type:complete len:442 (+) Transcript_27318:124-1449(+)